MELLTDLNRTSGITVLMVTHEADMAAFARTVVHFKDGLVERIERSTQGEGRHDRAARPQAARPTTRLAAARRRLGSD